MPPTSAHDAWNATPTGVAACRSRQAGTEPANDCIGCHMPRVDSSNNAHVATTNHRIPRVAVPENTLAETQNPAIAPTARS